MNSPFGTIFGNNGMPGWQLNLCPDPTANVVATTYADNDGDYVFGNVPPGKYVVRQVIPAGFAQTFPQTPVGQPTYGYHTPLIVAGQKTRGINFVNRKLPNPPAPIPAPGPSPAPVPIQSGLSLGGNVGDSPVPQTLAAFAAFKMNRARFFTGDNLAGPVSVGTLSNLRTYQAASLQTNLVFHLGSTGNKAPIGIIGKYVAGIPDELVKGQWGEYMNEQDLAQVDTPANYVLGLIEFSRAWRAKGGLVCLGNISRPNISENWNFYQAIFAARAAKYIDAWGFHIYPSTAAEAFPFYDQAITECQKQGVLCYCSEGSFHNVDAATAATQGALLIQGLKTRKLMFDWFPVGWTGTGAGICSLLNQDGTNHDPVYSDVMGAV